MSKVEREDLWHSVRNEIMLRRNFFLQLFQMKYFHLLGTRLLEEFVSEAYSESWKSNRPEVFCKKGVLRNFSKFTGKHLCLSLFFNKVAGLRQKETLAQVFFCEFCKISQNTFFTEHLWATTSVLDNSHNSQIKFNINLRWEKTIYSRSWNTSCSCFVHRCFAQRIFGSSRLGMV